MTMQGVELRVRYIIPDSPGKLAVFEFGGGEQTQEVAERDIHALIARMESDSKNGAQQADVFRFLVVEAKKRAEKLAKEEGPLDKNKLWVSATDLPVAPGQAVVGEKGEA